MSSATGRGQGPLDANSASSASGAVLYRTLPARHPSCRCFCLYFLTVKACARVTLAKAGDDDESSGADCFHIVAARGGCKVLSASPRRSSNPAAEVVELHVRMIGQQRHRHGRVDDPLGDHQRRQPLAERVVVLAGMPDGHLLRLPGLDRSDGDRLGRHQRDVAAAAGARVLRDRQRVQVDDARRELAILRGAGGWSL